MSCDNNHKWSEFFGLTYTGFWWSGERYDSYGNKIKERTAEKEIQSNE